jgi:type I site-specific restriction endonuclease
MKLTEADTRKKLIDPILERVGWRIGGHYVKEEVNPVKSKFKNKKSKLQFKTQKFL